MACAHVSWRSRRPIQPFHEIREFHRMLNANIRDRHLYYARTLRHAGDPLVTPKRRQTSRDGFVQCGRHDLDGMRDAVRILNRHSARADRHIGHISYSLFIRHQDASALRVVPPQIEPMVCKEEVCSERDVENRGQLQWLPWPP
jgi:hypothetical protein